MCGVVRHDEEAASEWDNRGCRPNGRTVVETEPVGTQNLDVHDSNLPCSSRQSCTVTRTAKAHQPRHGRASVAALRAACARGSLMRVRPAQLYWVAARRV